MEIDLFGEEGMDAAFDFLEAGPTAGPLAFAFAGFAGAGHAANGTVALIMQRIVGNLVLVNVFPNGFPRPLGHRVQFDNLAVRLVVEGVKLVAEGILKSRSLSDCRLELRNLSWVSSTSPPCARSALPINPGRAFRSLLSARALQQNFRARTVIMGSRSDRATMWCAAETLDELGGGRGARIASAHRPRDCLVAFAEEPGLRGRRRRRGSPRAGADGSGVDSRPARKRMNEMSEHAGWS